VIFALTITAYVLNFFYALIVLLLCKHGKECVLYVIHVIGFIIELAFYVALVVLYNMLVNSLIQVDLDAIIYFSDNKCSEGPLQEAFDQVSVDYKRDYVITGGWDWPSW
jgi:hypothetical protein